MRRFTAVVGLCAALATPLALAQGAAGARTLQGAPELRPLDLDAIYRNRWSAEELLRAEVRGEDGGVIGRVRDAIVGSDGVMRTLIVEAGGFHGIGDQHLGVPWPDVTLGPGLAWVQVPLEQVRNGSYGLLNHRPQQASTPQVEPDEWRVRALIGDFASLLDVPRYGFVRDVLFDDGGQARAVVVSRGPGTWGSAGTFVYPWQALKAHLAGHALPYSSSDTLPLQRFDYARLDDVSRPAAGAGSAAAGGSSADASDDAAQTRFDVADTNGDGVIDRIEFAQALAIAAPMDGAGERSADKREIFRWLDANGDNVLSRAETGWRPRLAASFDEADRDGDGRLDADEFGRLSLDTLRE